MYRRNRPAEVLLIEDNPADAGLTREAFRILGTTSRLSIVGSATEAMAFLERRDDYSSAPRPDIVLLDLNLPGMGGHEFLGWIKAAPALKRIPVIVQSASEHPEDIRDAYDKGANSYIVKPIDMDGFMTTMRAFEGFWLDAARLPDGS